MRPKILNHFAATNDMMSHKCSCDGSPLNKTAACARKEGKDPKGGLNAKGVASYRREN